MADVLQSFYDRHLSLYRIFRAFKTADNMLIKIVTDFNFATTLLAVNFTYSYHFSRQNSEKYVLFISLSGSSSFFVCLITFENINVFYNSYLSDFFKQLITLSSKKLLGNFFIKVH